MTVLAPLVQLFSKLNREADLSEWVVRSLDLPTTLTPFFGILQD
jgi:hypothetical protein